MTAPTPDRTPVPLDAAALDALGMSYPLLVAQARHALTLAEQVARLERELRDREAWLHLQEERETGDSATLATERAAREAAEALVEQFTEAAERVQDAPYGCAFCDSGVLRKRVDGSDPFHAHDCAWAMLAAAIRSLPDAPPTAAGEERAVQPEDYDETLDLGEADDEAGE